MFYKPVFLGLIFLLSICRVESASQLFFTPEKRGRIANQAQSWIETSVVPLSHEEVQILANTVYLTYASSLLDCKTRRATALFLTATLQLYKDIDTYAYETGRYQLLTRLVANLEALVSTREFINSAWSSCRTYIEADDLMLLHPSLVDAIKQFRDLTEEVSTAYLDACAAGIENDMGVSDACIDQFTHELAAGKIRNHTTVDAFNSLNRLLESAATLKETGTQAYVLGVSLDHYSADLLEAVKETAIVYYKQLYVWMVEQQVPTQYMTLMFDGDGIVEIERRTELLQDPVNLSYYSES